MTAENNYSETGSNPYYLNLNNTAKEFSFDENTNPQYGFLNTLSQFNIIAPGYDLQPIQIDPNISIESDLP